MYNNIYNAGFYPQIGMSQGFAVNQVPPSTGHHENTHGGDTAVKLLTGLECLAAVGGAGILYSLSKGKIHNVKTPVKTAVQTAEEGAEKATAQAFEQSDQTGRKRGLWARLNDSIEKDMYSQEELRSIQAKRAAGKGPDRPITGIIKSPYYVAKAIVTAPINLFRKAPKVEAEALQHAHTPPPTLERAAAQTDLPNASETSVLSETQTVATDTSTTAQQ